jgi:hypothetical protein
LFGNHGLRFRQAILDSCVISHKEGFIASPAVLYDADFPLPTKILIFVELVTNPSQFINAAGLPFPSHGFPYSWVANDPVSNGQSGPGEVPSPFGQVCSKVK